MILYGKPVAEKIYEEIKKEIAKPSIGAGKPFLAVILVGENSASLTYTRAKEKIAIELGIGFRLYHFPEIAREDEILKLINDLNRNDYISGIVVQLPLPSKIVTDNIIRKINPKKDVDGLLGDITSPAAEAILEILNYYKIGLNNKKITIVGRGKLVGAPLEKILIEKGIKADILDRHANNISETIKSADIIISATGNPELIKADMIKPSAIIIDAGTAEAGGKIMGDVSEEVYKKVESYSPVPGGVGPVTVACLMKNLVEAAKK